MRRRDKSGGRELQEARLTHCLVRRIAARSVTKSGGERQVYAESILKVCDSGVESRLEEGSRSISDEQYLRRPLSGRDVSPRGCNALALPNGILAMRMRAVEAQRERSAGPSQECTMNGVSSIRRQHSNGFMARNVPLETGVAWHQAD